MSGLGASEFAAFFRGVHGFEPFPWQQRLVEELLASGGQWPDRMSLPTASGKTACADIAVFVLACDAARAVGERIAPRRILFVVDRRVIVDQTLEHAEKIAEALKTARGAGVRRVADALKQIGADPDRPLDVYALRGGMYRESAWVRSPLQPSVITSTVDQIGSRLLFRGYGVSNTALPIHAALCAIDSLVILDEAHISRPFEETLQRIRRFAAGSERGAVGRAVQFVTMSATPRAESGKSTVYELGEADRSHDVLGKRLSVSKLARLRVVTKTGSGGKDSFSELINQAVSDASAMLKGGRQRVGVIVNRVATARAIAEELREQADTGRRGESGAFDVELLTGRMRPVDRDTVTQRLVRVRSMPADSDRAGVEGSSQATVVVATQTIEVGADLDFDALIAECASLDALRQRFGRLNRVGRWAHTDAVILARAADKKEGADDPIYGTALARTWAWLESRGGEGKVVDMSTMSIGRLLAGTEPELAAGLSTPQPRAATLLQSHLDMLCQTGPEPVPSPDVGPFLRGPAEASTDLSVVFRADLGEDPERWGEIVALCPPSSAEALPVRIGEMRRWLRGQHAIDAASSDLEGQTADAELRDSAAAVRHAFAWHREEKERRGLSGDEAGTLYPGMVLIVPVTTNDQRKAARRLGDLPAERVTSEESDSDTGDEQARARFGLDVGDEAFCIARDRLVLRLRREVYPKLPEAFDSLDAAEMEPDELHDRITEAIGTVTADVLARHKDDRRDTISAALERLKSRRDRRVEAHPLGGVVVMSRRRLGLFDPTDSDEHDRSVAAAGGEQLLDEHTDAVALWAGAFAKNIPISDSMRKCVELAARYHDVGKADPRFQAMLRGGNRLLADLGPPLAKSVRARRPNDTDRSGWPRGERHEMYSVRMVESALRDGTHPELAALSSHDADLVLHLIAAHHGHARPFAPVVVDDEAEPAEPFDYKIGETQWRFAPVESDDALHGHGYERLDSGVAERFWRLTRRYGWWGLAYLEALVRLADWKASEEAESKASDREPAHVAEQAEPIAATSEVGS